MKTTVEAQTTPIEPRWRKTAAILFAAALLSAPVLAQRQAQPRSGSSGGGGGGGGARHAPSGGSGGPSASGPSPSHSSGPSSSAHRGGSFGHSGPHRPTGSGRYDGGSYGGYYPHYGHHYYPSFSFGFGYGYGYYSPYYYGYSPYYYGYSPYYYGYSPYYYGGYSPYYYGYSRPYGYHQSYDYPRGGADTSYYGRQDPGAVALKVRPKTAEVYIDGRYVGTAGSFDGFPSYLWLGPGTYRLELVQEGYANLEREIEVTPAQVLEFKLRLEEGVASRPEVRSDRDYDRDDRRDYDRRTYDHDDRRDYPPPARDDGRDHERGAEIPSDARRDAAELVLEVEPEDASVYIDGRFVGTAAEVSTSTEPLVVDAGEHRVQVVHPDFETEERTVNVRAGEERLIEVSLRHDGRE